MDLINVLQRLNAISEESNKKPDADKDGVPDWADKKPGADDTEDKKEKANEDIMNVMRGLKAIQEAEEKCSECDCSPCECDDKVDESFMDKAKEFGKKALDTLGHGDDEDLIRDMQKKAGIPQTGNVPGKKTEALNTPKLADIMGVDPQQLRAAVARASAGKQTRSDVMMLSDTFVKLINMPDDTAIQAAANLIKSGNTNKPDMEEGNEFSGALKAAQAAGEEEFEVGGKKYKVNECGEMPMDMGAMSPLSMADGGDHEDDTAMSMGVPTAPEAKDRYTLSITKADGTTLNATTDVPDELAALMKAVGMGGTSSVAPAQDSPEEVEEEFGNTPDATKERDPRLHGQTKDWGLPGTGAGKPNYPGTRASGDNPMAESMFKEYLNFKSGK